MAVVYSEQVHARCGRELPVGTFALPEPPSLPPPATGCDLGQYENKELPHPKHSFIMVNFRNVPRKCTNECQNTRRTTTIVSFLTNFTKRQRKFLQTRSLFFKILKRLFFVCCISRFRDKKNPQQVQNMIHKKDKKSYLSHSRNTILKFEVKKKKNGARFLWVASSL